MEPPALAIPTHTHPPHTLALALALTLALALALALALSFALAIALTLTLTTSPLSLAATLVFTPTLILAHTLTRMVASATCMRCLSEFGEEDLLKCAGPGCSLRIHRACVEWTCSTRCADMCTATRNRQDELVIAQQDEPNEVGNGASSDRVAAEGGAPTEAEECCIRKLSLRQAE